MTKTKSPSRADLMKFHALKRAVEQDKLRIYLDYGKVNRPLSPVYDPWECLLPILVPTLIGLLLILFFPSFTLMPDLIFQLCQ